MTREEAEALNQELDYFGAFTSFQNWVNTASRRIDGDAICFDAFGRRCYMGKDFMRARDENAFPVYFDWDEKECERIMKILADRRAAALQDPQP